MNRDNDERIQRVFEYVMSLPESEREAALALACAGDMTLRGEVESMLRAQPRVGGVSGGPQRAAAPTGAEVTLDGAADAPTAISMPGETSGTQIGNYKLLQPLGEGGFGTVWMADQREPVKRRVALKIIKLGMDTKQVIARFEAERQALAMMDHPNIAKVFDAGTTARGRPYFVMEYIKGVPILEYCDTDKLDTRARLKLFGMVCHAIQHAHQKGIIHRDIKPTNVLVTMHDGVPVPKVIDFGIAKATNGALTAKTLFTEHRQVVGTPAYMSPEQAEMSGLDIDTRSDIYSLGVLLYELLTGTTPFPQSELMSKGFAEMMRIIREVEPEKPSTRSSSLGDTGVRTAEQRHVADPKKLGILLRGDLDWIVMKCLEKDRTRRYETANGLAADIQRHLNDEPVAAGPPDTIYTLRKFVKRNRAQVIAGIVVAAVLVLGIIGTTMGMVWANKEKERAEIEQNKATLAAKAEAKARVEAQENEKRALAEVKRAETISDFVTTALESSDAHNVGGGQDTTILEAMDKAIKDIESGRFKDDPETEARLRGTIGTIMQNNGRLKEAEPLFIKALDISKHLSSGDSPLVAEGLNNLAGVREALGRSAEAVPLYAEALAMRQRLFRGDNEYVGASLNNLGFALGSTEKFAEAEPVLIQALDMFRRLFPSDHPSTAFALNNLAWVRRMLGRASEAEPLMVEALKMNQGLYHGDHPNVAISLVNLAMVYEALGRVPEAEPLFVKSLEMYQRLYKGDHQDVAIGLQNVATARAVRGHVAEAEPLFAESLAMCRRLYPSDHWQTASVSVKLANIQRRLGKATQAEPLYISALDMYRRLNQGDHVDIAKSLTSLALVRKELGRTAESVPLQEQAVDMQRRLFRADDPVVLTSEEDLARMYWQLHVFEKSIPLFEQVLSKKDRKLGRKSLSTLATAANLGGNYRDAGKFLEARPLLEEAFPASTQYQWQNYVGPILLDVYTKTAGPDAPDDVGKAIAVVKKMIMPARYALPKNGLEFAEALAQLGQPLMELKAWSEAEPLIRECLEIREKARPDAWTTFNTKSLLGGTLLGQKKYAEAEPLLLESYQGMKEREASMPPPARVRISEALERLVGLYEASGNETEAAKWRTALEASRAKEKEGK